MTVPNNNIKIINYCLFLILLLTTYPNNQEVLLYVVQKFFNRFSTQAFPSIITHGRQVDRTVHLCGTLSKLMCIIIHHISQ